jgi:hypothetical protein
MEGSMNRRTVIPTKTIDTIEVGPYRANLRRWEHYPGETPFYTVELWHDWHLKFTDEYEGLPEHRWSRMREELSVFIATQAMGLGASENMTVRRKLKDDTG